MKSNTCHKRAARQTAASVQNGAGTRAELRHKIDTAPPPIPQIDMPRVFWPKVEKTAGCWNWTGSVDSSGYGKLKARGRVLKASRVVYAHMREEPGAAHVLHTCDNPRCVNPDHLYLGDDKQNARDKRERGRGANMHGPFGWAWE